MPSIFSRKSRSQASEPAPVSSPFQQQHQQQQQQQFQHHYNQHQHQQQQQQQQQQLAHDYRDPRDLVRRPSLPTHVHLQTAGRSTDNLSSPALDLPYDDIPPEDSHRVDLSHRHPAHRASTIQPVTAGAGAAPAPAPASVPANPGDRPTISLVGPARQEQQQQQHEPALYSHDNSTSDHLDKSSIEQSWPSGPQEIPEKSPARLHKKKGFFSRHQSSASASQGKSAKSDSSLGRSVSIKHKFASASNHTSNTDLNNNNNSNNTQQRASGQHPEEHVLGRLQTTPQQSGIDHQQNDNDNDNNNTATTPTGDRPGSPTAHVPSTPQTPLDYSQRLNEYSFHTQRHHHRSTSADSFPSQVSYNIRPPFHEEITQPPSPISRPSPRLVASDPWPQQQHALSRPDQLGFPQRRPVSQQSSQRSFPLYVHSSDLLAPQDSSRRPSAQHPSLTPQVSDMAAIDRPGGATSRSADSQSQLPPRKESLAAQGGQSPYPPGTQGSSFKGNISQQNLTDGTGRETPPAGPSSKLQDEIDSQDFAALLQKHEELQTKYNKVKRYYFEKDAQVTQLQNTVAHQRMAVSRTVLDDNEYTARFNRLDGAIKELSFSIRKDWKTVPDWLHPSVNEDAVTVGTKEMTGVGRAVISRWIAEEIFDRYFHPGLERTFSERLKTIEWNLRRQQTPTFNEDDKENQIARISNWRRTTLDGMTDLLQATSASENQALLVDYLVEKLLATLQCDLKEPAPPELPQGVRTIIENAINIIEKIPQESRDIVVDYILPGAPVLENNMKVEAGLPPLTRPLSKENSSPSGERGHDNVDDMDTDKEPSSNSPQGGGDHKSSPPRFPQNRDQRKKYPFGSLISKKSAATAPSPSASDSRSASNSDAPKERDEQLPTEKRPRVRFATFVAVEVRGRGMNNVLVPAPVYTLES